MSEQQLSEERRATKRARYLEKATDLTERQAHALAYREMGYSHSAIAREIGSTKGTVATWMRRTVAQYGLSTVETKTTEERGGITEVTPDELTALPGPVREQYLEHARRAPEYIPGDVAAQLEGEI